MCGRSVQRIHIGPSSRDVTARSRAAMVLSDMTAAFFSGKIRKTRKFGPD